MNDIPASQRLIVALDVDTAKEALALVDRLGDAVSFYKVGWQLFFGTHFAMVGELASRGKKVFLDLKMSDIPATVRKAIGNAPADFAKAVQLMTIDGLGDLVTAAKAGAEPSGKLQFLMLTALSSMDDQDIKELYGEGATLAGIVRHKAGKALAAGCDGLIASGESVRDLRREFGDDFIIVTPGIRPKGFAANDHKRSVSPYDAILYGADYLVVGRPITQADDPRAVAEGVVSEIERALRHRKPQPGCGAGTAVPGGAV